MSGWVVVLGLLGCKPEPEPTCGTAGPDGDGDGVTDACDVCPTVPDPDQGDADGDGLGDLCLCDPQPSRCVDGLAGPYPCDNVDLASFMPTAALGGGVTNDVWGWSDPESGREYALVGLDTGVAFVDVTNPYCPVVTGRLAATGAPSLWRDLETYGSWLYVGSEAENHGIQVFDLRRLADYDGYAIAFDPDAVYDGLGTSHTVTIDPVSGVLAASGGETCDGGMHLLDLSDPAAPVFAGCYGQAGYIHDAQCLTYAGPDTEHEGAVICITANGPSATISVVDATDPTNPRELADLDYLEAGGFYAHQGWFTSDGRYFVFGDELDEPTFGIATTTYVFDLLDLDAPTYVGAHVHETTAIDHQQYIVGDHLFQSNYTAGLRIFDLAGVATADLEEIAWFDIHPPDDAAAFVGTWSNYPFLPSGIVPTTSIFTGLFVLKPNLP